jgi:hypothetical protein
MKPLKTRNTPSFMPRAFEVPNMSSVKTTIEINREIMTVKALFLSEFLSADEPTRIGNKGNIQGAKIVNIPAINDTIMSCNST